MMSYRTKRNIIIGVAFLTLVLPVISILIYDDSYDFIQFCMIIEFYSIVGWVFFGMYFIQRLPNSVTYVIFGLTVFPVLYFLGHYITVLFRY